MSVEDWDDVIAVHLRGAFLVTQAAARAMKESGGGHILQVVSNSGLAGGFGQANYAAAKAGLMGLLRTCVLELTRLNIRTNALWPIAETDMTQVVFDRASEAAAKAGAEAPSPASLGFGSTEAVAEGLAWLLSGHAAALNGQCLTFNGRKAALWSHPQECFEVFSEDPMDGEALTQWLGSTTPQPLARPKMVP
jgi:NAD(P)-dependent dehydrogenase (short-subunit alcohol dehydrogenase family)